jgi:hypothetical protein
LFRCHKAKTEGIAASLEWCTRNTLCSLHTPHATLPNIFRQIENFPSFGEEKQIVYALISPTRSHEFV